jgi:hypothetical protein
LLLFFLLFPPRQLHLREFLNRVLGIDAWTAAATVNAVLRVATASGAPGCHCKGVPRVMLGHYFLTL